MKPIDLVSYAEFSEKIPTAFLTQEEPRTSSSTWRTVASHFYDFGFVVFATMFMGAMFNQSFTILLTGPSLQSAFSQEEIFGLAFNFLPLVTFTYFFMCYFMNHGQSLGMMVFKQRFELESKDVRQTAVYAAQSLFLCFSGGLSYFVRPEAWQKIKAHDYLYSEFITFKEHSPVHLLTEIERFTVEEEVEESVEEELIAA